MCLLQGQFGAGCPTNWSLGQLTLCDCSSKHPRGKDEGTSTPVSVHGTWVRDRAVPSNQEKAAGHTYLHLLLTASLVTIKGLQLIAPLPFPYTHNCHY